MELLKKMTFIPLQLFLVLLLVLPASCQHKEIPDADLEQNVKFIVDDLPPSHYQFYLRNRPLVYDEFKKICANIRDPSTVKSDSFFASLHANLTFEDPDYLSNYRHGKKILNQICSKIGIIPKSCWGYEHSCDVIHLDPECKDENQKIAWFNQADFGYVLERRKEMERYCSPDKYSNDSVKSSLECTKYFRTCRGQNLMIKFGRLPREKSFITNPVDLFKAGDVGGWNCDLQTKRIPEQKGQNGTLESWFTELSGYQKLQTDPSKSCDVTIDKRAYIIKLDSSSNMYHYFCNFINLYATMHLNNKFSTDNQIIIWDNHLPVGKFEKTWEAFSKNPLKSIQEFEGKRVCFKKFVFTLLPRMVEGLYYNTPLVSRCAKTGLFNAFNRYLLHKLKVKQEYNVVRHKETNNEEIRVTISSRTTNYRQIVNEQVLVNATKTRSNKYKVNLIDFASIDFLEQLKITQNTDLLVGIHGAGLTNLLFLPDWAALLELETCGDKCYSDLARLRGISHFAPRTESEKKKFTKKIIVDDNFCKKNKLVGHEKFSNYQVDVEQYLKLLDKAVEKVRHGRGDYFKKVDTGTNDNQSYSQETKVQFEANEHVEL